MLDQVREGKMLSYYVYILRCRDGSFYVGQTSDPEARLYQHQNGLVKGYTHGRRPVTLVWAEEFGTRAEAMAGEKQLKGWSKAKKAALVHENIPLLKFLATRGSHADCWRIGLTTANEGRPLALREPQGREHLREPDETVTWKSGISEPSE